MRILKRILAGTLTLALLAVPFVIYFNAQALSDYFALRNYTPPADIASLAAQDTMTAYAKHIFYLNHPQLQSDINQFRNNCQIAEQAIVLGCYHSSEAGIYVYQVSDVRLNGVEQVTAAHEMLHGAYDRLSGKDKNYVDGLLQNFYQNDLHDQRVMAEINEYKQTEPNDVVNEMHSVFGTEVANLPAPLEAYYSRYFTNRSAVTNFAAAYQSEFTTRDDQVKADDARLAQMKAQINSEESALQSQLGQISADRAKLDSERSSNVEQYNADVTGFNDEVNTYNSSVESLRADINSYNQLVNARNAIANQLASLDQAIDTSLAPQTAQ